MDSRSTTSSDRFLSLFSTSPPDPTSSPLELDEVDIFSINPNPNTNHLRSSPPTNPNPNPIKMLTSSSSPSRFGRESTTGILAALTSTPSTPSALQRKPSFSSSSTSSPTINIPTIPKLKKSNSEYLGRVYHQSLPMNVPVVPGKGRRGRKEDSDDDDEQQRKGEEEEEEILPPHEIVDRASGRGEPMTTFSVLEGVGRTLKGRDLRRVRNAVWRKTGFLD